MKIVRIQGGLGNQMFQYALAYKLKQLYPDERVLLDTIQFKGYPWHPYELNNVFGVELPFASFFEVAKMANPFPGYTRFGRIAGGIFNRFVGERSHYISESQQFVFDDSVLTKEGDFYYDGYWCNQGYFIDIRPNILEIYSFKPTLSPHNEEMRMRIRDCNSVSLHVRRGNYLLFDEFKDICEKPYYKNAISYIKNHVSDPRFFVFSNDIQWCKDNLKDLMDDYVFVENDEPMNNYVDMQLMSCCRHNIIAHSTFSWWAAWLNQNTDKIVVAPSIWNNKYKDTGKPQLDEWVLIGNEEP